MFTTTDICLLVVFCSVSMLICCCIANRKTVMELIERVQTGIDEVSKYRQTLDEACGFMIELPKDLTGLRRPLKAWMNTFKFGHNVYDTDKLYLDCNDNEWYVEGHYKESHFYDESIEVNASQSIIVKASEVICN